MTDEVQDRELAIRRIKAKREFKTHVAVYLVVNAALVGIWAASGAGYFWPVWSIGGWGIGLFFHWWSTFREERPITEDEIQREMGSGNG
ncbi:MAG: 2TM domain-containing protein [Microthrixaceae bacterium]